MPRRVKMTKRRWQREKKVFAKLVKEGRKALGNLDDHPTHEARRRF
jgi:hypothetical protein